MFWHLHTVQMYIIYFSSTEYFMKEEKKFAYDQLNSKW
jgi:hypothetical protein